MDRDVIEKIITSMDTGTLVKMLATQGVNIQAEPTSGQELVDAAQGGDKIESWNDMKVPGASSARPPIHDPQTYTEQRAQERPEYMQDGQSPAEDWYVSGPVGQ
jgi:hypothetical protein